MTDLTSKTKESATDPVYRQLRDLIVTHRLAVGVSLVERKVAERLGTSRSSARAAIRRLVHEGYAVSETLGTYKRAVVAPLTVDDMEELYAVLGALDGIGARRAALLPVRKRKRLVEQMRATNAALLEVATERSDISATYETDERFHRLYVEAAGGERLVARYDAVKPQSERYGRMYATALLDENRILTSFGEHERIADAIESGDADGAELMAATNWRMAARRFRQVIETDGEREHW